MMAHRPAALLSYARSDDEQGYLTELGAWLSREVESRTGQPFPILQDQQDVAWGQSWQTRLEKMFDAGTFLIPVLTPGFFRSEWCRQEVEQFLEHERTLRREDLIIPIYYLTVPAMERSTKNSQTTPDPLVEIMLQRQYIDWRGLLSQSFRHRAVRNALARMAERIASALAVQSEH